MPIYEYQCPKCGEFEVTQRITEKPLTKCSTCRSRVKKLISNTSFQLKGSGWYVTDYGRKGNGGKDAGKSKDDGGAKKDSASDSKSETKSESKSESKTNKSDTSAKAA